MSGMAVTRRWEANETDCQANQTIRFSSILDNFSNAILLTNISLMHHFLKKPIEHQGTVNHARRISLPCRPADDSATPLN
jgi:hypothetical protein